MATHDYVIANQSGAAFRTDLNNALAAIQSNNSNSSSPSDTVAYQWWADTNTGILKIRNSANNAWVELLQLDGTLTLEDGSASTPALAFRDDLNTGIFSAGADTVNIATGGTERLEISGSQTIFNDAGANIDFRIESDTKTHMFFMDSSANAVGINTSSPACMLHITDTGSGGDGVLENLRLNSAQNNTNDGNKIQFTRVNGASGSISCKKVASNNNTDMIFGTRLSNTESEKFRMTGTGVFTTGGETSPDAGVGGITLQKGTAGDKAITIKCTNIDHGVTIYDETDTWLSIAQSSSNKGGVEIRGYTDTAGSDPGVRIRGIIASDSDQNYIPLVFMGNEANGTGVQNIAADRKIASFQNANADQIVNITGTGICFGTDKDVANALDDYEEGDWTPLPTAGTFQQATGRYTKIGRMVFCTYSVQFENGGGGNFAQFNGIPFDNIASSQGENIHSVSGGNSSADGNIVGRMGTGVAIVFANYQGTNYRYNSGAIDGHTFKGGFLYMSSV